MKKSLILSLLIATALLLGACATSSSNDSVASSSTSITSSETEVKDFGDLLGELTDQIIGLF